MARGRKPTEPRYYASRGSYYIKFRGRQYCLAVGPEGGETLGRAWEEFWKVVNGEGEYEPATANQDVLLSGIITRYLAFVKKERKPQTAELRTQHLEGCRTALGHLKVKNITRGAVNEYMDSRTSWGRGTRINYVRSLQAALNWAVEEGEITANPLKGRMKVGTPASRGKECLIYTEDHNTMLGTVTQDFGDVLRFLEGTGCRPDELCKLTAGYFVPQHGCFVLPSDPRKEDSHKTAHANKTRVIWITDSIREMVLERVKRYPTGRIFRSSTGKPWNSHKIGNNFRDYRTKLGLSSKLSPYSYRHTYCTTFLLHGGPDGGPGSPMILAELLGTSVKMLETHYSHLDAWRNGLGNYARHFAQRMRTLQLPREE